MTLSGGHSDYDPSREALVVPAGVGLYTVLGAWAAVSSTTNMMQSSNYTVEPICQYRTSAPHVKWAVLDHP